MRLIAIFLTALFLLTSCEGERVGQGVVYDLQTNLLMEGVEYYDIHNPQYFYTNEEGKYYLTGPFGSCVSGCPDYEVEFQKPGYKTKRISNPNGDIYLETEE